MTGCAPKQGYDVVAGSRILAARWALLVARGYGWLAWPH